MIYVNFNIDYEVFCLNGRFMYKILVNIKKQMKKSKLDKLVIVTILGLTLSVHINCFADNPIIQTKYTADPAPLVHNDTVFLYVGHDEDDAIGFKMFNWQLYTSTDMVNWTDHGMIASLKMFSWAVENGAWAPQCIERDGKFYFYCTVQGKGIGILVANSPYGPFIDPIGKPLIGGNFDSIDPTAFIDDDGQAYLYWGNPNLWYVKLNKDMISFEGEPIKDSRISKIKNQPDPFRYQEGPWAYKRNGKYYMAYASTCCPEGIGYAMSNSPIGPWEYKGMIMEGDRRSSGNHPGIIDYKGNTYVFGFNYAILKQTMAKHYERRSVCVEKINFNNDGTIQEIPFWSTTSGATQLETLNPYVRVEAETMAYSEGIKTYKSFIWEHDNIWNRGKKLGEMIYVTSIHNGDYIKVQGVNFSKGSSSIDVRIASLYGGIMEIRMDKIDGPMIGSIQISTSGEGDVWKTITATVKNIKGVHDVYFVFRGEKDLFNFDWWKINSK
jgi:arabinoxylan arabinofuranohydrolase